MADQGRAEPIRVGDVVTRGPRGSFGSTDRGIVVERNAPGQPRTQLVVQISAGVTMHSDFEREWTVVPEAERTTSERVRSAGLQWQPSWRDAGERIPDSESWEWALTCALLTPPEMARVFPEHGDWPTSFDELLLAVAEVLDDRRHGDRTLGSAMARLGVQ